MVNEPGVPFVPVHVAMNPNVTGAPGAMRPFQAAFVTLTSAPVWV